MAPIFPNMLFLRSEIPSGMCAKLRTAAASNSRDHASQSLLFLLAHATHIYFCSSHTPRSWWITQSTQYHGRDCNNVTSFSQRTTPIACSLCECWTRHDLHILVTAPLCFDRKSRATCAQSFAPRQQATTEIMRRISLFFAWSRHTYIFLFFAHNPFVVNHTINAIPPERLQQCNCKLKRKLSKLPLPCSLQIQHGATAGHVTRFMSPGRLRRTKRKQNRKLHALITIAILQSYEE